MPPSYLDPRRSKSQTSELDVVSSSCARSVMSKSLLYILYCCLNTILYIIIMIFVLFLLSFDRSRRDMMRIGHLMTTTFVLQNSILMKLNLIQFDLCLLRPSAKKYVLQFACVSFIFVLSLFASLFLCLFIYLPC